jgi:hypothetical protein
MYLARVLTIAAFASAAITGAASAATSEKLTGMPLVPGSTPVSAAPIETKMAMCNYQIGTKSYSISNGGSTSAPAFFSKSIPGAKKFPYSAGGVDGIAMFASDGSGMVHIEPGLLIYYKFVPGIPAGRYEAVSKGGC